MIYLAWLTAGAILGPIIGRWLHALGANDWRDEAEAECAGSFQGHSPDLAAMPQAEAEARGLV